jgi:hypothetical protein
MGGAVHIDHRQIIESYFGGFREREREMLRMILTPDFHHVSSFGEWRDRDAMLEAIWSGVGQRWAVNLQVFGEAPEFMVRYQREGLPGSEPSPMSIAEFIRFEDDKIAEIEVYIGRQSAKSDSA